MNKVNAAFFSLLFILFSCKTTKKGGTAGTGLSREQLTEMVNRQAPEFSWMRQRGKVTYNDGTNNYSASLTLKMREDSLVWGSITMMLEFLRAQVTADTAYYINRTARQYGTFPTSDLKRILAVPSLTVEALQNILLAHPPFGISDAHTFTAENGVYKLVNQMPAGREEIEIDPNSLRMRRYTFKQNETQYVVINYEGFYEEEKLQLPGKITAEAHLPAKTVLTLENITYTILDTDEAPFTIPAGYTKRE